MQSSMQDSGLGGGGELSFLNLRGGGIIGSNAMGGYTVGNNAMYNSRGLRFKGLVTVVLRKFFKISAYKSLFFIHLRMNSTFQEPLVFMLRYTFKEAADLQGPPPPKCGPGFI